MKGACLRAASNNGKWDTWLKDLISNPIQRQKPEGRTSQARWHLEVKICRSCLTAYLSA